MMEVKNTALMSPAQEQCPYVLMIATAATDAADFIKVFY